MRRSRGISGRLARSVALSGGIALAGWSRRALSPSGAACAVLVGSAVDFGGGWRWSTLLLTFFGTSSGLGRLSRRSPAATEKGPASANLVDSVEARGSRRDLVQVLANGGAAATVAVARAARPHSSLDLAFAGALAAATADTWATEVGKTSPSRPRLLFTRRTAPPGTSGAVSRRGLLASLAGSALIGVTGAALLVPARRLRWGAAITAAGVLGALADSVVGATIQASYYCPICGLGTERRRHGCGTPTVLQRGFAWCDNDVVNVGCTLSGALAAVILAVPLGAACRHADCQYRTV
jgi:uncharacterized protein (TIGR00297 family)